MNGSEVNRLVAFPVSVPCQRSSNTVCLKINYSKKKVVYSIVNNARFKNVYRLHWV